MEYEFKIQSSVPAQIEFADAEWVQPWFNKLYASGWTRKRVATEGDILIITFERDGNRTIHDDAAERHCLMAEVLEIVRAGNVPTDDLLKKIINLGG